MATNFARTVKKLKFIYSVVMKTIICIHSISVIKHFNYAGTNDNSNDILCIIEYTNSFQKSVI